MTDFERIAASVPLNRTAAMVTGGGQDDPEFTPEQKRENLAGFIQKLDRAIASASDPAERKRLGQQKLQGQTAIKELKLRRTTDPREFNHFFIDVARETLTRPVYKMIRDEAFRRMDAHNAASAAARAVE